MASAKTVSPSKGVCAGRMVRANPSWAAIAMRRQAAGLSAASHAITPIVVLNGVLKAPSGDDNCASAAICSAGGALNANSPTRSAIHGKPVAGSTTLPAAFTTARTPTVTPDCRVADAVPTPPLSAPARAPTPTPTVPTATSTPAAAQAE
ncbi:Uncharacterised protein [Mycobacterium tuberculosis]|uniref:Uncharacterized protein n=2 Tax=Mycobacterium tuberculosis TaxID=1773 RepID=A0A654TQ76_MYCTX|nr:Uncharacterised protein [Mycobacterium tuberculosis]